MALALWEPFAVGRAGRFDPFADLLDDFFGAGRETSLAPRPPVTKLHSDEDGYTFRFDLPGVTKDDIDISLDGDVLTVSAERKNGKDEDAQVQAVTAAVTVCPRTPTTPVSRPTTRTACSS